MKKIEIIKNSKGYNSCCTNCGKSQPGGNPQPLLVYFKEDGETRGSYYTVCSRTCAEELKEDFEK